MRDWLIRNAEPLQAAGALATAFAALTAVVIIPYQVAQADRIQRDQTAREIYREFLNLTVQKPELAGADYCTMENPRELTAYGAYVDYLAYTAEQMIDTSPDWREPMASYVEDHMAYLCDPANRLSRSPDITGLVADLGLACEPKRACG